MFNKRFSSNLKQRKRMILSILCFCVALLGLGYAAFETNLLVGGTLSIKSNKVTVTFDANGGTVDTQSKRVMVNKTYGDLPTPTREDYVFAGWSRSTLPNEYQEVEYIKFNGSQYIDTGIIPTNHMTEVKFDFEDYATETIIGTENQVGYYDFGSFNKRYFIGFNNGSEGHYGNWTTGVHTAIFNGENNEVKVDNDLLVNNRDISSPTSLHIGVRKIAEGFYLTGKIYYLKITDKTTGELVRSFIPCYRKSDNVIGMYDLVEEVFYANQGTGAFSKGSNIEQITSETRMITNDNHTIYATWRKND